jgi:5-methyltetrahydrofolate--homocysteine methyltransferase
MRMGVLEDLRQSIISGDRERSRALTEKARSEGVAAREIVVDGIAAAMGVVGEKFRANEFFVPELLIAQRAMKAALGALEGEEVDHIGTVVIGTVKGDLHDIGKNLVAAMLEGAGFKVVDLGVDVSAEEFAAAAKENSADMVAMSALLTTTMGAMRETVSLLGSNGIDTRVIIGGAPVTQAYAEEIGADGYSADAAAAVELAKSLIGA